MNAGESVVNQTDTIFRIWILLNSSYTHPLTDFGSLPQRDRMSRAEELRIHQNFKNFESNCES